jgi:hypothetical protein
VIVDGIDAEADDLGAAPVKLVLEARHAPKLGRTPLA